MLPRTLVAVLVVAGLSTAEAIAAPAVIVAAPDPFVAGHPVTVRVVPTDLPPGAVVTLMGSTRTAAGPCTPSGICAGLGAPLTLLDRAASPPGVYDVTFTLPPSVPVGPPVHLQAVVRSQGVVIAASPVVSRGVQAAVLGCTDPAFGTYDPLATVDDGSCGCRLNAAPVTAADLAESDGCTHLDRLDLSRYVDGDVSLPALVTVGELVARDNPTLASVAVPALALADRVILTRLAGLTDLDLSGLVAGDLTILEAGLGALALPAMTDGALSVGDLPQLASLDLSALEVATQVVVGGTPLSSIELPALRQTGSLVLYDGPVSHVDLPDATSLGRVSLINLPGLAHLSAPRAPVVVDLNLRGVVGAGPLTFALRNDGDAPVVFDHATASLTLPGFTRSDEVAVMGQGDVSLSMPQLRWLDLLDVFDVSGRLELDLPAVVSMETVSVYDVSGLTTLALPSLWLVSQVSVERCSDLTTLSVPSLSDANYITLVGNPSLSVVDVAALTCADDWRLRAVDNPQLCVTTAFPVGQAPGACAASGTDNLCDP